MPSAKVRLVLVCGKILERQDDKRSQLLDVAVAREGFFRYRKAKAPARTIASTNSVTVTSMGRWTRLSAWPQPPGMLAKEEEMLGQLSNSRLAKRPASPACAAVGSFTEDRFLLDGATKR